MKFSIQALKVNQRLLVIIGLAVSVAVVQAGIGLYELNKENRSIRTVYEDRMVALNQLASISNSLLHIESQGFNIAGETVEVTTADRKKTTVLNKTVVDEFVPVIEKELKTIPEVWSAYLATYLTPEEKVLAAKFAASKDNFIENAVKPALVQMHKLDAAETMRLVDSMPASYKLAKNDVDALIQLQNDVAKQEYQTAIANYDSIRMLTFSGLAGAIALLIWLGLYITRTITKPLDKTVQVFSNIELGNFDSLIDAKGTDELSRVLQSLKSMQAKLKKNVDEQQALAVQVSYQSALFEAQLAAISKSTGVIEFSMDGKVIAANDIFLNVLGYSRAEAIGQHHTTFVDAVYKNSVEYRQFWEKLNHGEFVSGQYLRIAKGGKEIWLEASYNPIMDANGKPYKVVKYATDITEQKIKNVDYEGQIAAINKSQGAVELGLDGKVLKANQNYLNMLGYTEKELIGQHVSIVLDPTFAKSAAYTSLWDKLVKGGYDSGQYKRIAKGGCEVWIQASYNPIYDLHGKVEKIINYTIDITEQKLLAADNAGQISAINKIQGVIEFDLTGKIIAVNENFANVTGYSQNEIVGNHHSMFVEPVYKSSHDYKAFWERLAHGEAEAGQYKRLAKGGREVWLQASYNPILDMNGKPFKVVKYATDITEQHNNAVALAEAVEETQAIIDGAKTGDLSSRVPLDGKTGAIASLCDGVNALMDKMTEVIVQVREAGETINTAAGEISSGNSDLSSRTEQQASSLEETASSMEELASTVKQNAENAKQANQLAAAASGVAVKGGEVVGQVVNTMSAINESAHKIEDIISVIDGIAFQTNILALNAAVEAARAGEQGRGFAVVAGEVRTLAQRSASAAKEIKELITDSVSKTAEGTVLVENAGKTMEEIVTSVQRVTDIMGEISAASSEQSAGIDQVNNAITSMDEVTQQNAALVEEAAAAAESLVDQAESLIEVVSVFKLSGNGESNNRRAPHSPMRSSGSASNRYSAPRPAAKSASDFSIEDAKQAHLKWKSRLVNYVAGNSDERLQVEKVSRDDECALGKWIYGEAQQYEHLPEFKELKATHTEFHQSVGDIVRCVHNHKESEARYLLGGTFSKTSKRTIAAIQEIGTSMNKRSSTQLKTARKTGTDDSEWEEF
jgi:PAS domain S-box-containing protein